MATLTLVVTILVGIAAAVGAIGVIWKKVIQPVAKLIAELDTLLPLLTSLNKVFGDDLKTLEVLEKIASEFRTDSGSSLRDAVNRLEALAQKSESNADLLRTSIETAKQISQLDRDKMDSFMIAIDRLNTKADAGLIASLKNQEIVQRVEEATSRTEADALALQIEAEQKRRTRG